MKLPLPHREELAIYQLRKNENTPRGRNLRNRKRRRERQQRIEASRARREGLRQAKSP